MQMQTVTRSRHASGRGRTRPEFSRRRRCCAGSREDVFLDASGRQSLFNDIAPIYDTLNDTLSLGLHRVWKARSGSRKCRLQRPHLLSLSLPVADECCAVGRAPRGWTRTRRVLRQR